MMCKIRFFCLFFILMPAVLPAQQVKTAYGQIFAIIDNDSLSLSNANIAILDAKDSTIIKGGVSDSKGLFNIRFDYHGDRTYLLKASYTGMQSAFRDLSEISERSNRLNLGAIQLIEGVELAEFIITSPVSDIRLVGDTTVINADAFPTPEGSYLEELVKRIPGLEYDPVGKSLRYNGTPISAINVNGEEFFSNNLSMALENLPVDLISEIKIYDKRSELEKVTGVRSEGENFVLDIQTRSELNGALLVSAKAGVGNNGKKEQELISNYFKQGGESISLFYNSGNRNMTTRYKENIQHVVGANFTVKPTKIITVNGNVNYMSSHHGNQSTGYTEQYLTSGNRYQLSDDENSSKQQDISTNTSLIWEIDEKTYLNIFGYLNLREGENSNNSRQALFSADPQVDLSDPFAEVAFVSDDTKINDFRMGSHFSDKTNNYSLSANLTRKLNAKGSSFSLTIQHVGNRGSTKSFTNSSTSYFRLLSHTGSDSVLLRMQSHLTPSARNNQNIGLVFSHSFSEKINMQLSYNVGNNRQKSDRNTYDLTPFIDAESAYFLPEHLPLGYEAGYIDSLSNRSNSYTVGQDLALRINFTNDKWDINSGFTVSPELRKIDQKTGLLQADTANRVVRLQPTIMMKWRKEKINIRFNYHGDTQQPNLTDLLSLTDNSDPLNIIRGNPDLKPAYNQYANLELNDQRGDFSASLRWHNSVNSFTRAVVYDLQTGGRESYPVNVNGNWDGNAMIRYQKRIRSFGIAAHTGSSYNRYVNLVNKGGREQPERSITQSKGLNANLRVSYLPQWGSFIMTGDWRFLHSHNSLRQSDNVTRNFAIIMNGFANLPGNIQLRTDLNYQFRNGTGIEKGDDQFVWNTGVSWRFMKKKQCELSIFWSDVLSDKKDYDRSVSADRFYERRTQQIGSYFIASFRYSFNHTIAK